MPIGIESLKMAEQSKLGTKGMFYALIGAAVLGPLCAFWALLLDAWLASLARPAAETRLLLAWRDAMPWPQAVARITAAATLLSGPEGGLSDREENLARACGFIPTTLGPRVLRADTAPLAALAAITVATAP